MRLFAIFLLLLFIGCNKEKLKAPEAFFIQPEGVSFAVSSTSLQGTSSSNITDIWYYVNGKFKGAFPIGHLLPIPSTGPTELAFFPGIRTNGISATRAPYEFYGAIYVDTSVSPGTIVKRNFQFRYKTDAVFRWLENFEGFGTVTGISIQKSNTTDTTFTILNKATNPSADVFEGNKCLYFATDNDRRVAQFESVAQFPLPKSGSPVFLEMDYKCTAGFEIGVYAGSSYSSVLGVNNSDTWNKIYIRLSDAVSYLQGNCGWYIRTFKNSNNAKDEFWIDNLKIVSY